MGAGERDYFGEDVHLNNHLWLADLKRDHPEYLKKARVLEIGSKVWTGTIRPFFEDCYYIGVDQEDGDGVDIVCQGDETGFHPGYFDTLAMFSVFEHTPKWREILVHNLQWLRVGGLFMTCFGAEGNARHEPEPWAIVPHQEFLDFCDTLPLTIMDAFFEEERYGKNCPGAFDVLAKKYDERILRG